MYLKTTTDEEATGEVARIYAAQKEQLGFVMDAVRSFTTRSDILPLYTTFINGARDSFSLGPKAWRMITLIAAKSVPSTYCSLVYGKQLISDLGTKERVLAVQRDFRSAGLSDKEIEMLAYAEKVSNNASRITEHDIDRLRSVGFTDIEISDIALCAAFRCFVSRYFDAVGAEPDAAYVDDDPEFRAALTVGRGI